VKITSLQVQRKEGRNVQASPREGATGKAGFRSRTHINVQSGGGGEGRQSEKTKKKGLKEGES